MTSERLHGLRQRLPCRRAAGALGQIPGPRIPHARQARAMAVRRRARLLSQGQRRDRSATREPQLAAPCDLAAGDGLGTRSARSTRRAASDDRGRLGPAGASRRHGRDGGRPGAALSDLVRRGLLPGADPDIAYALARAYNDWIADFCKAAPDRLFAAAMLPLQNMDLRARRTAAGGAAFRASAASSSGRCSSKTTTSTIRITTRYGPSLERRGIIAAVHPTPGLWNPEWTSHGPFFEKVKDRLVQPTAAGWRRRAVRRRQRRCRPDDVLHGGDAARPSDGADPVQLARQPYVRRLDPDRLHGDAALSRR